MALNLSSSMTFVALLLFCASFDSLTCVNIQPLTLEKQSSTMNHKDWNYCSRSKILTHNSGLKIRIEHHGGNEISEMTPIVPKDMNTLESIRLIRDGTDYFRRNYHKIAQPQKRFDSVLSLKR